MRKTLIILLLIAALFAVGCRTTVPPDCAGDGQSVSDSQNTPPLPAGEAMDISRDGNRLTVNIKLPAEGGAEFSLLALTDRKYLENWDANAELALLGIGQIKLDESGAGSLTMTLKENASDFIVVLNAPSGRYIGEAE